jgi:4-hydroxy-3-polyprenylbenzoate decarboxylase
MIIQKKIAIAIGGASGAIYAKVLLDKLTQLRPQTAAIGVVMSKNARFNWQYELENDDYLKYDFDFYESNDFMAPFASGSAKYDTMIICPCSMGLLARIALGVSTDLTTRAADVMLKERRRLIIVPRETPLSIIHINNMKTVTEAGAIICPAIPSFYSRPQTVEAMIATVIDRVLDLAGFDLTTYRWGDAASH